MSIRMDSSSKVQHFWPPYKGSASLKEFFPIYQACLLFFSESINLFPDSKWFVSMIPLLPYARCQSDLSKRFYIIIFLWNEVLWECSSLWLPGPLTALNDDINSLAAEGPPSYYPVVSEATHLPSQFHQSTNSIHHNFPSLTVGQCEQLVHSCKTSAPSLPLGPSPALSS